jgi:hypothetical protein
MVVGKGAFSKDSTQYKWLAADLAAVDRTLTPWVAVFLHAPWYNSNHAHHDDTEETEYLALMEPLLHQYGVDLLFAGHVHAYERSLPVLNNVPTPGAMTEINIGDGGNREGPASSYYDQPAWSAFREASFGHGQLEIINSTHAHWAWHRNQDAVKVTGDDVWFVKRSALGAGSGAFGLRSFDFAPNQLGEEWVEGRQHDGWKHAPADAYTKPRVEYTRHTHVEF